MTNKERTFREELAQQLVTLSTSGFGFVAALAWNEAIQELVKSYIITFFPESAGIISKFAYALVITIFAVFVTYQLSRFAARFSPKE